MDLVRSVSDGRGAGGRSTSLSTLYPHISQDKQLVIFYFEELGRDSVCIETVRRPLFSRSGDLLDLSTLMGISCRPEGFSLNSSDTPAF
jgi:hypothetical protein